MQVVAATKPTRKPGQATAFLVGVDAERKAPGLKTLGLVGDAAVQAVLGTAAIALPWKSVRSVPVGSDWVVFLGLGDRAKLTQEKVGTLTNLGCRAAAGLGCTLAVTSLVGDTRHKSALQAVVQGALIGELDFDQWKSKPANSAGPDAKPAPPKAALTELQVLVPDARAAKPVLERSIALAVAVNDSRLLSNTPANVCTPSYLAAAAKERAKNGGYSVTVKSREQLRREGYGALCGVGQGSMHEEQLITMDYHPKGAKKTVALVGKGVCFDSGGISLKPGDKMWEMKYDKVGACNVIALMARLKDLGVKHRVIGIVAAVENMPGPQAQRPGDIVTAKDGTTIEVLNTDAEGRLILADAITHARTFQPEWILDMATLTGACDVAVGPTYVAAMGNRPDLVAKVVANAEAAGDKAWPLPQGEEFDEATKGTYADLQNISLTIRAGSSIGGAFLKHFAKDTPWVHLDIASKAWTGGTDYFAKGPTAAGLRIAAQQLLAA